MRIDNQHTPVLLEESINLLHPKPNDTFLDVTAGYGGHAKKVLGITNNPSGAVLIDRDESAIKELNKLFKGEKVNITHGNFYEVSKKLLEQGKQFDLVLADLGVSSPHLDMASRGFSFTKDGPLDMRMDQTQTLMADEIVNTYSEVRLAKLISDYGEEPKARSIARVIVRNRPVHSTQKLAKIIAKAWPKFAKHHPATRTFQALRIAVNDELSLIKLSLPIWIDLLSEGGRIAVITFHSLEDRIVKQAFKEVSGNNYDSRIQLLTKRPIVSNKDELAFNPRARSAKLRAAVKIKT